MQLPERETGAHSPDAVPCLAGGSAQHARIELRLQCAQVAFERRLQQRAPRGRILGRLHGRARCRARARLPRRAHRRQRLWRARAWCGRQQRVQFRRQRGHQPLHGLVQCRRVAPLRVHLHACKHSVLGCTKARQGAWPAASMRIVPDTCSAWAQAVQRLCDLRRAWQRRKRSPSARRRPTGAPHQASGRLARSAAHSSACRQRASRRSFSSVHRRREGRQPRAADALAGRPRRPSRPRGAARAGISSCHPTRRIGL